MKQKILKYDVVFEEQPEGGYTVTVPSLPGCISEGDTFEEAKTNIAEAITAYLESLAKDGEDIPEGILLYLSGKLVCNTQSFNNYAFSKFKKSPQIFEEKRILHSSSRRKSYCS